MVRNIALLELTWRWKCWQRATGQRSNRRRFSCLPLPRRRLPNSSLFIWTSIRDVSSRYKLTWATPTWTPSFTVPRKPNRQSPTIPPSHLLKSPKNQKSENIFYRYESDFLCSWRAHANRFSAQRIKWWYWWRSTSAKVGRLKNSSPKQVYPMIPFFDGIYFTLQVSLIFEMDLREYENFWHIFVADIPEKECSRSLLSMVHGKAANRVLRKEPKELHKNEIKKTDKLFVNDQFQSKLHKVKILSVTAKQVRRDQTSNLLDRFVWIGQSLYIFEFHITHFTL